MARNKLGIIQLELPDITLSNDLGDGELEEITTLLNEEQKEIIKTLGGSKLVLLSMNITDNSSNKLELHRNLLSVEKTGGVYMFTIVVNYVGNPLPIELYEDSGKYYIYS